MRAIWNGLALGLWVTIGVSTAALAKSRGQWVTWESGALRCRIPHGFLVQTRRGGVQARRDNPYTLVTIVSRRVPRRLSAGRVLEKFLAGLQAGRRIRSYRILGAGPVNASASYRVSTTRGDMKGFASAWYLGPYLLLLSIHGELNDRQLSHLVRVILPTIQAVGPTGPGSAGIGPRTGTSRGGASFRAAPSARMLPKEQWLKQPGLKGYYVGAVYRGEISTYYSSQGAFSSFQAGASKKAGDFHLALYRNGKARGVLYIFEFMYGPVVSTSRNIPFKFEGRYTFRHGVLKVTMKLRNRPSTMYGAERRHAGIKIRARQVRNGVLQVSVWIRGRQSRRWSPVPVESKYLVGWFRK